MAALSNETKRGIEYLRDIFQSGKTLTLRDPQVLGEGLAHYFHFEVKGNNKKWDMCLAERNLEDLPSTPELRDGANKLARGLESRLRNAEPYLYITANGQMFHIEPIWPPKIYLGSTFASVPVKIIDRKAGKQGACYVELNSWRTPSARNAFDLFEDIVNTVRRGLDAGEITVFPPPSAPQFLSLNENAKSPSPVSVAEFIQTKVWNLGTLAGNSTRNVVWLPDPWDLDYFGISRPQVLQRAAILDSQDKIASLPDEDEFARVGRTMLAQEGPDKVEPPTRTDEFRTAIETYKPKGQLGEGGSGRVVRAEDPDGAAFALKYLKPEALSTQKSRRFRNEIQFCASNTHKNIIRVLDWGLTTVGGIEVPFYVMPIYPKTLKVVMSSSPDPAMLLDLFDQILAGVHSAHEQGVWHRDLKPQNVLIDPKEGIAVVSDFGIAHFAEPLLQTLVQTGRHERVGSFQYAAPEQRTGSAVTHLADIYSLGVILYEMFTGEILQGTGHTPIAASNPEFSFLDPIVNLMAQQIPGNRIQTISEVRNKLSAGRNGGRSA